MNNAKTKDIGLLIIRIGIGAMMLYHGLPKLMAGPQNWEVLGKAMGFLGITFAPQFWGFMAAFAEAVGGIALVAGLCFRPFCALLTFEMIVASVMHLSKGDGLFVASHAIELAILFFGLIFIGPGSYSIDEKMGCCCCCK